MGLYYYLIISAILFFSWWVSSTLKNKFKTYSRVQLRNGMTGAQIAEQMLADHGINNVRIMAVKGRLTDHYNPKDRTVNLSEAVYSQRNAAAAAVAAHECGHAVQHAKAYGWLQMRSALVPLVGVTSQLSQWLIIGGLLLGFSGIGMGLSSLLVIFGFSCMAMATLFSFITLPVEYDASNRALEWLRRKNMLSQKEQFIAKDALKWAARTYLVAALGSLAMLLYWAFQIFASRN